MAKEDSQDSGGLAMDAALLAREAQEEFRKMLSSVEGEKDVVIERELMSILDHVTPMKLIRRYVIWYELVDSSYSTKTVLL